MLSGRSDIPLDERGRAEAALLAMRLADRPVAAVHSSPRARARETAVPIARRHGLPVAVAPALDEIDFGAWAGRRFADLDAEPAWRRWNTARGGARAPGGETMQEAIARAGDHVRRAAAERSPLLCISHCDVIRGLVAHCLGLDLDHMLRFDVDPGSLTTLGFGAAGGRVVAVNERLT